MQVIKENKEWVNKQIVDFECPQCKSTLRESKVKMTMIGYEADMGTWVYEAICPVCESRQVIREDKMRPVR